MKMTKKNTPELWNRFFDGPASAQEDIFRLARHEKGVLWQRIEKVVLKELASFEKLEIIEIGAGLGTYAALMARRGASVTILDYSEVALRRAREFFDRNGLTARFVKHNALSLPGELLHKYDIAMSFGLTEHFKGKERFLINKAHFDLLRIGGMALISVPNRHNLPYRILKLACELKGIWYFGEEYPYSRKELCDICHQMGIANYFLLGDSFLASFNLINPFLVSRHLNRFFNNRKTDISQIPKQRGTFLDQYLGHSLMLCARYQPPLNQ